MIALPLSLIIFFIDPILTIQIDKLFDIPTTF